MTKTALITGASRGIGRAVAIKLAADGYYVLLNYNASAGMAEDTLALIKKNGGDGECMPFNVADSANVKEILGTWITENPENHIEVLVNNAGITADNLMVFMNEAEWDKVISTNQYGFFHVTKQVLQNMLIKKSGSIINIVSLSGQKGQAGQVNYAASKGALIAATKSLAAEVGKKKVRVNAVSPGFIHSDMTANLDEGTLKKMIPLNRFGTAEEVAEVVSFIASDRASYITGEVISVNGGLYS